MTYYRLIDFYKYYYIKVVIIIKSYATNQFLSYTTNQIFQKKNQFYKSL